MDDRQPPLPEETSEATPETYEPPIVEDLDNSYGPAVTAAGASRGPVNAAPRDL